MRVYIHCEAEEDGGPNMTIKLKLPKKWKTGPCNNLKKVRWRQCCGAHLCFQRRCSPLSLHPM